jgi:hypothetical protein
VKKIRPDEFHLFAGEDVPGEAPAPALLHEGGVARAVARRVDNVKGVTLRPDDRRERPGLRGGRIPPHHLLVGEELRLARNQGDGVGRSENFDAELFLKEEVSADVVLVKMGVDDLTERPAVQKGGEFRGGETAAGVDQQAVHEIGRHPVNGLSADLPAHPDLRDLFERRGFDHPLSLF